MSNEVKSTEKSGKSTQMTKQMRNQRIKTEEIEVSENQPERKITRSIIRSALAINHDLGENMRITRSMSWENEALTQNINKNAEFAMVGRTDDSYINPRNFEEVWNHQDEYQRLMWRNAIKNEFDNMFEHEVWEKMKRLKFPMAGGN